LTHLKGRCDCGRTIHFPKDARYGQRWTCQDCGRVWVLSTTGDPLKRAPSRPPQDDGRFACRKKKEAAGHVFDGLADAARFMLRLLVFVLIGLCMATKMAVDMALPLLERMYLRTMKDIEEKSLSKDGVRTSVAEEGVHESAPEQE
jgi:hypothetical protein